MSARQNDRDDCSDDALGRLRALGELTAVVTHEINNYLNGILLQVAILERASPATGAPQELAVIRRLGTDAASLIRRLQEVNRESPSPHIVNLNEVASMVARELQVSGTSSWLELSLAPEAPQAWVYSGCLHRLVQLLLCHCRTVSAPKLGKVVLRTGQADNLTFIELEDTGPSVSAEQLPQIFEAFVFAREGGDDTTLAICRVMARRLRGSIEAKNLSQGGMAFRVQFSRAKGVEDSTG